MENNAYSLSNGLQILIDWISFTVTNSSYSADDVIDFMGFSPALFVEMPTGSNGYCRRKQYETISVLYDGREDMGIHVNISGSSIGTLFSAFKESCLVPECPFGDCYEFHNDDIFSHFCKEVLKIGHFTRIDVAIDDLGCNFYSMDEIFEKFKSHAIVSRFRSFRPEYEFAMTGEKVGQTFYFGNRQSPIMFRIYDKQLEQNKGLAKDDENRITIPWVRWEIELHKERSNEFAQLLVEKNTVPRIAVGVLNYYFRIIQNDDINRSRCSNEAKWDAFIDGIEKLRLAVSKRQKTMEDKYRWIEEQVSPTLALIVADNGGDVSILEDLAVKNMHRISGKDKELLMRTAPELYEQYTEEEE